MLGRRKRREPISRMADSAVRLGSVPPDCAENHAIDREKLAFLQSANTVLEKLETANLLREQGELATAIVAFQIILVRHPEVQADCYAQIGHAQYQLNHFREAVTAYLKAIEYGACATSLADFMDAAQEALESTFVERVSPPN